MRRSEGDAKFYNRSSAEQLRISDRRRRGCRRRLMITNGGTGALIGRPKAPSRKVRSRLRAYYPYRAEYSRSSRKTESLNSTKIVIRKRLVARPVPRSDAEPSISSSDHCLLAGEPKRYGHDATELEAVADVAQELRFRHLRDVYTYLTASIRIFDRDFARHVDERSL